MLRDADTLLGPAVEETVTGLTLTPADRAAVKLAQRYAAAIDAAESHADALEKLGPKLLATLESLGATPAARARLREGGQGGGKPNRLAQLRAARPA